MPDVTLMNVLRWTDQECVDFLEAKRWPGGPICPVCDACDPYPIERRTVTKNLVRKLYRCRACGRQFTPTIGTTFEDSKIPLSMWFAAIYMMSAGGGLNAHQIHREMGVTYKSARSMCLRIRAALSDAAATLSSTTRHSDTTIRLDMNFDEIISRLSTRRIQRRAAEP